MLVVEDQKEQIDLLRSYFEKMSDLDVVYLEKSKYVSGLKLELIDIALLDVEIDEKTGIDLAYDIRKSNENVVVVFMTSHEKYAYEAFGVSAFDYILKPISEEMLFSHVDKWIEEVDNRKYLRDNKYQKFTISSKSEYKEIPYNNILYFEKIGKSIKVVCEHQDSPCYTIRDSINQIQTRLDESVFVKTHQAFIVNLNKSSGIEEQNILIGQSRTKIPISRRNVGKIKELVNKRIWG